MSLQTRNKTNPRVGEEIVLRGAVQGIGLRPAVARWARDCGLNGTVINRPDGVMIHVEGAATHVQRFAEGLSQRLPPAAHVERVEQKSVAALGLSCFRLDVEANAASLVTWVPRDTVVCEACLEEVADASDRRAGYALTSCASCGPRYSIITAMPYQRRRTAMSDFPCCPSCRHEYDSIDDRRFHAETNCCPVCGPRVWCADRDGHILARHDKAIDVAVEALVDGKIVALRGIGGYQLLVDATRQSAVARIRRRKHRAEKPLAVMVRTIAEVERFARLDHVERAELISEGNPIVIVAQRDANELAPAVSRGINTIGVMLATTPLHRALLNGLGRGVVATSANTEGRPIEYEVNGAQRRLADIADLWLHHDRTIVRPIDDSVVRVIGQRAVTLRLGRGLGPLRLDLDALRTMGKPDPPAMLALGGQMKSIAISNTKQAVLGPHLGELDEAATRQRWVEHVADVCRLYGTQPELLVCDQHPGYFTTAWARRQGIPLVAVQHHHAHVVAAMVEQQWLDREVLGFAFDGTGYGSDDTVWGGEVLQATAEDYQRVARLRPFRLAGSEAAIRQPWRVAVGLVCDAIGVSAARRLSFANVSAPTRDHVIDLLKRDRFSPPTTSMGRLFDGIAALALNMPEANYEAQGAIQLEAACDHSCGGQYDLPRREGSCIEFDWRPLVAAVYEDRLRKIAPGVIAMRFHRAVANSIVTLAQRFASPWVVLAGGVFQNRVLSGLILEQWPNTAGTLGLPGRIPPGDGGLAAGQLAAATARYFRKGI